MTHAPEKEIASPGENLSMELTGLALSRVPNCPGCYIMRDRQRRPIYVGKAKNLRARLRSYISATDERYTVQFLMRRAFHVEFLVTATEKEALLLENTLIKTYHPRYNIRLKDDKTYVSLRLDPREDFPRVTVVRRYRKDGAKYFGPYHDTKAVRKTLRRIHRLFPLRTCSDHVLANRSRPCLYHQMKQCLAPCVGLVNREAYHQMVEQVAMVLEGRSNDLEKVLRAEMQQCAARMEYEQAAVLRDRLYDLERTMERQYTTDVSGVKDRDVIGVYREGRICEVQVLLYRGGRMLSGRAFSFERVETPLEELLSSFVLQFYASAPTVPQEVLTPVPLEDAEVLEEILQEQRGSRVVIHYPQRGEKRALVELADRNAKSRFQEQRLADKAKQDALETIQKGLHLPRLPYRIECFDISTIQGEKTVASMVTFEDGRAAKQRYRRFSMKTVSGQDDFASMREVLLRRYRRAIDEDDLPDLVLIDGGRGQLGVATAVLRDLGIEDTPHVGIAKSRAQEEGGHSPERIFVPGRMNPIVLPQKGAAIQLLARIRDEAHRFAITYHRQRRSKAVLRTRLTDISDVGPARAKALLKKFGSVAKIQEATVAQLTETPGISQALAEKIQQNLQARK